MINGLYAVINGRVGGVLSRLKIDADKDWNEKRIHNFRELEVGYILECNADGIPIYKGRTYNQWVNAYNKGQASYEDYLIARKILVDDIGEEQAIKEVKDARTKEE